MPVFHPGTREGVGKPTKNTIKNQGENSTMFLKKDTHFYRLLELIGVSGEVSQTSLEILCAGYAKKLLCTVRKKIKIRFEGEVIGDLKVLTGKGQGNSIRLFKDAVYLLDYINKGMAKHYLEATQGHIFKTELKTLRRHKIAETYAMAKMAGIEINPFIKPELLATQSTQNISGTTKLFYDSREIKKVSKENTVGYTRLTGLILAKGNIYVTFTANKQLTDWNITNENKMRGYVNRIVLNNCSSEIYCNENTHMKINNLIIFGKSTQIMSEMLFGKNSKKFTYLGEGDVYKNRFYIPLNKTGILLLKLITENNFEKKIAQMLLNANKDFIKLEKHICVAKNSKGQYIYSAISNNISGLKTIKSVAETEYKKEYLIYILQWQRNVLSEFFSNTPNVKLMVSKSEDLPEKLINYIYRE